MKRSHRFYSNARRDMFAGLLILAVCVAAGVWSSAAFLSADTSLSGGAVMLAMFAAGGLTLSARKFRRCLDSFRSAWQADVADNLRAVRPRL